MEEVFEKYASNIVADVVPANCVGVEGVTQSLAMYTEASVAPGMIFLRRVLGAFLRADNGLHVTAPRVVPNTFQITKLSDEVVMDKLFVHSDAAAGFIDA